MSASAEIRRNSSDDTSELTCKTTSDHTTNATAPAASVSSSEPLSHTDPMKNLPANISRVELDGVSYLKVKEGQGEVLFPAESKVFYNPVQEFNRDLSISILRAFAVEYKKEGKNTEKRRRREAYLRRQQNECDDDNTTSGAAETVNSNDCNGYPGSASPPGGDDNNSFGAELRQSPERPEGGLRILEALAASGLRSIRYAKEVPGISDIVANDLSKQAVDCIQRNIEYNNLTHLITASHSDASLLLYMNRDSSLGQQFDVIDVDPYGSPHLFLDGAVQAVAEGGLLLVTCTDMGVLCGNSPDACHAKYGATSLKTRSCHEMALRIVLQSIESHANRYGRFIEPLISFSVDFYIRLAVRVHSSPLQVKQSYTKIGMVYNCVGCDTCTPQVLGRIEVNGSSIRHRLPLGPTVNERCEHCDSRHQVAGPVWLGPLHDRAFLQQLIAQLEEQPPHNGQVLGTERRIRGVVQMLQEELPDVPFYYVHDKICSVVGSIPGKLQRFKSAILNAGYRVSASHCHRASIKTDAPSSVVWDIVRAHEKTMPSKRMRKNTGQPGYNILNKPTVTQVDFTTHPDAIPESQEKSLLRFQINPERFWGPMTRSTSKILGEGQQEKKRKNQGRKYKKQRERRALLAELESNDGDKALPSLTNEEPVNSSEPMQTQEQELKQDLKRIRLDKS